MNHQEKQQWIEAVMADKDLTPATARYAFGIYKHMYGTKDESWPGAKALSKATGLNDSQFWRYNQALVAAGYLEVTAVPGRQNHYRLLVPTSNEGGYPPQLEVHPPQDEVTPTSGGGTNTTSKTTRKTSMKDNNSGPVVADAPTVPATSNEKVRESGKDIASSPNLPTPLNAETPSLSNDEASNAPTSIGGGSGTNPFRYNGRIYWTKAEVEEARRKDKELVAIGDEW